MSIPPAVDLRAERHSSNDHDTHGSDPVRLRQVRDIHWEGARRSEYCWFSVTYVVAAAVVAVIATVLTAPVVYLAAFVVAIPMLTVSVRRFHDRGRSGWNLVINLIPLVGTIIYLVGMARDGEPDANRYAPRHLLRSRSVTMLGGDSLPGSA